MSTTKQTVLAVEGMTCGSCVRHVQDALEKLPGVSTVVVNLREGRAVIDHRLAAADLATLVNAVRDAGYECRVESAP